VGRPTTLARALCLPALLTACAQGEFRDGFALADTDGGASSAGAPAAQVAFGDSVPAAAGPACPSAATYVYVLGGSNQLYRFDPSKMTFTLIGALKCLTAPTHMTVDRQGTAFIVAGGRIYTASTEDASCSLLATWKADAAYYDFSLTFIGTSNAAVDDTLYLMNDAVTLVTFNTVTGVRTPVGPAIAVPSTQGDMTSNGDGTLYLLRNDANAALYEIDPKSAAVIKSELVGALGQGNQALAFWGGAFYAFENDAVFKIEPSTKTAARVATAPVSIAGAGQSTCVPKTPK
jgi:hypothetical protein